MSQDNPGINPDDSPFHYMTTDPSEVGTEPNRFAEAIAELLNQRSEVRRVDWLAKSGGIAVYGRNLTELGQQLRGNVDVRDDVELNIWL